VMKLETEKRMEVDVESLCMALDFEMAGILERHKNAPGKGDWTAGYRFWVNFGTLNLSPGQVLEHDLILRRTNWRAENGFLGEEGNLKAQALALAEAPLSEVSSPATDMLMFEDDPTLDVVAVL